jgi:uncharacterized protein (DUF1778 family)
MPRQPKPKPVGRPKLAKGDAKAEMLRVRATPEELKAFDRAAKASGQKRSEWIRSTLKAATQIPERATFQREVR